MQAAREMVTMRSRSLVSLFLWSFVAALLSQNMVIPVMSTSFDDQKTYYSPDPHAGTPPAGSHGTPPSHGTTPSPHHNPPSHHGTPTAPGGNCGNPPHHDPTPTPSTPSNPPSGGGGYYNPPSSTPTPTPTTPVYTSPPTTPTPTTPVYTTPPTTPIDPGTPSIPTIPTPPIDPNSPFIGTCNYWRTHPTVIWGVLGWWGTLGNAFGTTNIPSFGTTMTLPQALSNTRTDGFGALYREGTASFLNSMVNNRFPFTTNQVRERFVSALSSNKAAAAQAHVFKLANEGRLKPRN